MEICSHDYLQCNAFFAGSGYYVPSTHLRFYPAVAWPPQAADRRTTDGQCGKWRRLHISTYMHRIASPLQQRIRLSPGAVVGTIDVRSQPFSPITLRRSRGPTTQTTTTTTAPSTTAIAYKRPRIITAARSVIERTTTTTTSHVESVTQRFALTAYSRWKLHPNLDDDGA